MKFSSYNKPHAGVIGPYNYQYVGLGGHCPPSDCPNCCDQNFQLEYGTIKRIGFDWSETLYNNDECKIIKSEWGFESTNAAPVRLRDSEIEGSSTYVKISEGEEDRRYHVINRITTEEGTTHQRLICVDISKCLGDTVILAIDQCDGSTSYTNPIAYDDWDTSKSYTLTKGVYTKDQLFLHECVSEMVITLVTGSATVTNNAGQFNMTNIPFTLTNGGNDLDPFVINVLEDSVIFYTREFC